MATSNPAPTNTTTDSAPASATEVPTVATCITNFMTPEGKSKNSKIPNTTKSSTGQSSAPGAQRKKDPSKHQSSRMARLYSHVPYRRVLRTVLQEREEELRKAFPGTNRKLTRQTQDASIITDIHPHTEDDVIALEEYNEIIVKAKESIAIKAQEKIYDGDTILIYGYSDVIKDVLLAAVANRKRFSLIIVESSVGYKNGVDPTGRPTMTQNGHEIHALHIMKYIAPKIKDGTISVTFIHLNGLSFVIRTVTKFLMTAYALLTNGGVLARIGSAQIALMAHKKNIPVVVCCETFKFCDKSPVDSFFQNQRGHLDAERKKTSEGKESSEATAASAKLATAMSKLSLQPNVPISVHNQYCKTIIEENAFLKAPTLKYDITPAKFVTAVITEVDVFPAKSIPLLLQVQDSRKATRCERTWSPSNLSPASADSCSPEQQQSSEKKE